MIRALPIPHCPPSRTGDPPCRRAAAASGRRTTADHGQAGLFTAGIALATVLLALLVAFLGSVAIDRARSRNAADATALAAATGDLDAARRLADRHGCLVLELAGPTPAHPDGAATVRCGRADATSRARATWSATP